MEDVNGQSTHQGPLSFASSSLISVDHDKSSETTAVAALDSIPPELWLHIFQTSYFPNTDMQNITLSCRLFRRLAQPLLFSTWFYHLNLCRIRVEGEPGNLMYWRSTSDFDRLLQRLDFIASNQIAFAVKTVSLNSPSYTHTQRSDLPETIMDGQDILGVLFDKLGHLPNVTTFSCLNIQIALPHFETIFRWPKLIDFHAKLVFPEIYIPTSTSEVELETLTIVNDDSGTSPWITSLISRLRRSSIRCLCVLTINTPILFQGLANGNPMPYLRTLNLELGVADVPHFADLLLRCPSLEELILQRGWLGNLYASIQISPLPDNLIPNLRYFRGFISDTLTYMRGRPLHFLDITTFLDDDVETVLRTVQIAYPHLRHIYLCLDPVLTGSLDRIFQLFPNLKACYIRSDAKIERIEMEQMILPYLRTADLPVSLEYLKIFDTYGYERVAGYHTDNNIILNEDLTVPFPPDVLQRLIYKCQHLREISFVCGVGNAKGDFDMWWRCSAYGDVAPKRWFEKYTLWEF